jgi:hypothetical protein
LPAVTIRWAVSIEESSCHGRVLDIAAAADNAASVIPSRTMIVHAVLSLQDIVRFMKSEIAPAFVPGTLAQ